VLLARNPDNFQPYVDEINQTKTTTGGGVQAAVGIATDVADPESVARAFREIEEKFPGAPVAAAVFNASGRFVRKPLLELEVEEFVGGFDVGV
jgi:NAD(P)-dependent dehydrogenase (short-subunit alcohol dehydrogenase family)